MTYRSYYEIIKLNKSIPHPTTFIIIDQVNYISSIKYNLIIKHLINPYLKLVLNSNLFLSLIIIKLYLLFAFV